MGTGLVSFYEAAKSLVPLNVKEIWQSTSKINSRQGILSSACLQKYEKTDIRKKIDPQNIHKCYVV